MKLRHESSFFQTGSYLQLKEGPSDMTESDSAM